MAETLSMFNSKDYNSKINKAIFFPGLTVDHFTKVKAYILLKEAQRRFVDLSAITALDVGCGIGNSHYYFKDMFKRLSGVDVSVDAIEQASKLNDWVEYKIYDGSVLPYPDNFFQLVFTINVLHHVTPELWPQFLSQIRRVLRKDGLFIIFEHNPNNMLTRHVVNNCEFDKDACLLKRKVMKDLLGQAGFQTIRSYTLLTVPHLSFIMRWLDSTLGHFPFGAQYYISAVPYPSKRKNTSPLRKGDSLLPDLQ